MNPISTLTSNGFTKLHSCGCGGGESTWKCNGRPNVIRIKNIAKVAEVRENGRSGKIIKSFKLESIDQAITYVKEN